MNSFLDSLLSCFRALDKSHNWPYVGFLIYKVTLRIKYLILLSYEELKKNFVPAQLLCAPPSGSTFYFPNTPKVIQVPPVPCLPFQETPHSSHLDQALAPAHECPFHPQTEKLCKHEMVHISVDCNNQKYPYIQI